MNSVSATPAALTMVVKGTFLEVRLRETPRALRRSSSDPALQCTLSQALKKSGDESDDDAASTRFETESNCSTRTMSIGSKCDLGKWADIDFETESVCSGHDVQSVSDLSLDGLETANVRAVCPPPGSFTVGVSAPPGSWSAARPVGARTTLMLDNLPKDCTRTQIMDCLDSTGFKGQYDLVYLPTNFKTWEACRYAFVNMISPEAASQVKQSLDGFEGFRREGQQALTVCWSDIQGLFANVERYKNSPVMHPDVPEQYKPLLLVNGAPTVFPKPTKSIKAPPRLRRASRQ